MNLLFIKKLLNILALCWGQSQGSSSIAFRVDTTLNEEQKRYMWKRLRRPCFLLAPDGYNAEFFKRSWVVVGPDVTEVVLLSIFTSASGKLLKAWSSTAISLIPKIDMLVRFLAVIQCTTVSLRY